MDKDLTKREFVNLTELTNYCNISKCHFGLKCIGRRTHEWSGDEYIRKPRKGVTKNSIRYYKGVEIPLPVEGDFFSNRKIWRVSDVIEFKKKLDEVSRVMVNWGK